MNRSRNGTNALGWFTDYREHGARWLGGADLTLTDAQAPAALGALGGLGSPAGSCVWHVVGLQRSIREWAMRQGWGGRPVRVEQAQGILVAGLGMLAMYYGYSRMRRISESSRDSWMKT
jgi:hypothetical protein